MKLIVGLGNPGREYVGTRHNIGFDVIDTLAQRLGWVSGQDGFNQQARSKFDGLVLDGTMGDGERALLLKPMTYMNLSGRSVRSAMDFYRLSPAEIMVVLDDLALPVGRIRIRPGGSSGGHNGLKDIERVLGGSDYPRLRIGIDPPPPGVPGKAYVLGRWTSEQKDKIAQAVARACDAIVTWAARGIEPAMNEYNRGDEG